MLVTLRVKPFNSQIKFVILYCQPYNSYNVSLENLALDQLIIPNLIFFPYSHHLPH